jgi:peptidoglycan/LPS O-acetylase OafA/YrhL
MKNGGNAPPRTVNRIALLDGMRGAAALYVVLHHAYSEVRAVAGNHWFVERFAWLEYGHYAVAVFIVLSGYSLAAGDPLRGGFWAYLRRRARRIFPPYYAALFLSILLIIYVPALRRTDDPRWGPIALPALEARVIVAHLLLLHNLRYWALWKIDPPMWSIATEWQVYFLLPAILWISRRWGWAAGVFLTALLSLLPVAVDRTRADSIGTWYAGLFALGMAAASAHRWPRSPRWLIPLGMASCLPFLDGPAVADIVVGTATAAFLVLAAEGRAPEWLVAPFESRMAVLLGTFSYSLYLVHYPFMAWAAATLVGLNLPIEARLLILIGPVTLGCVALAFVFHLVAERPFMPRDARSLSRTTIAAAVSPAP